MNIYVILNGAGFVKNLVAFKREILRFTQNDKKHWYQELEIDMLSSRPGKSRKLPVGGWTCLADFFGPGENNSK